MRVKCVWPLMVLTLAGPAVLAQNTKPDPEVVAREMGMPRFAVDVQLVNMGFSVRDRSGRLIRDLDRGDFKVYEDGVEQTIRYFANERATPLTVGIVIDYSPSQEGFEDENIYIALSFFKRILRPAMDRAFIVAFGNRIREICPLTNSLERIEYALRHVEDLYDDSPRIGPSVRRSGGSAVIDAVHWSAKERLADVPGRKALIMIGDGKENSSRMRLFDVIELLQATDVIFYGLDNGGSQSRANRKLRNRMPLIAEESGGRDFVIGETTLRQAFDQVEAELRALYTLGYHSTNTRRDGKFRQVEIRPVEKTLLVRAKPGYYAR